MDGIGLLWFFEIGGCGMLAVRLCQLGLAVGLAVVGIFAGMPQASAQDRPKAEIVPNIAHPVLSLAFSPDGRLLLSGGHDGTLKLWDAETGQLLRTWLAHAQWIRSVAFSPDGRRMLSGGRNTLKLWDVTTGQLIRTFEGYSSDVRALMFSPNGKRVLSIGGTFKLWEADSGRLIRTLAWPSEVLVPVAFSRDGRHIVSGCGWYCDHTVKLRSATTGQLLRTFAGHSAPVDVVAFSADGTRLLSGSEDGMLKLWDVATGALVRTIQGSAHIRNWAAAFSPDGSRIFWQNHLWDAATGNLLRTFEAALDAVAFSPDGASIVRAGSHLKMWDATSGRLIRGFAAEASPVNYLAFSSNGTRLLTASGIWDTASGRLMHSFEQLHDITSVAISPDGTRVLSGGSDNTLKLWDATSGQLIRTSKVTPARLRQSRSRLTVNTCSLAVETTRSGFGIALGES